MKINKHDLYKKNKEQDDELINSILYMLTILVSILFIGYGIANLIIHKIIAGTVEFISGITIIILNLYFLNKKKRLKIPTYILNSICILIGIYLYIDGGFHDTGLFWILSFPVILIPTLGIRNGFIWIIVIISILFTLYILSIFNIIEVAFDGITSLSAMIVFIIIAYVLATYERYRKKSKKEINKLEGLLPICSYCKKIKSDKGNWQSVDLYLSQKADMDFSHGICPDCMKEIYPDYYERMQKSK